MGASPRPLIFKSLFYEYDILNSKDRVADVVLLACSLVGFDYIYVSIGDDFLRDD